VALVLVVLDGSEVVIGVVVVVGGLHVLGFDLRIGDVPEEFGQFGPGVDEDDLVLLFGDDGLLVELGALAVGGVELEHVRDGERRVEGALDVDADGEFELAPASLLDDEGPRGDG
jgi:hypothetical protein